MRQNGDYNTLTKRLMDTSLDVVHHIRHSAIFLGQRTTSALYIIFHNTFRIGLACGTLFMTYNALSHVPIPSAKRTKETQRKWDVAGESLQYVPLNFPSSSSYFQTRNYSVIDAPYLSTLDRQTLMKTEGYWISRWNFCFLPIWKYNERNDVIVSRLDHD